MSPIFGSLGSNYSLGEAVSNFWPFGYSSQTQEELKQKIASIWPGQVYLFYKGRQAIECGLKALDLPAGSGVLLSAFTCIAIEQAIVKAGLRPVYADLASGQVNADMEQLETALKKFAGSCRVIIIQHTLGYPANVEKIIPWAKKNNLMVIEDLAQAAGAEDQSGQLLGSQADMVILSFGQDKIIDAVTGGACIISSNVANQRPRVVENATKMEKTAIKVPLYLTGRDRIYPLYTWLIRRTFGWGVGKLLIKLGQFIGWLKSPVSDPMPSMGQLSGLTAGWAQKRLAKLKQEVERRRQIMKIYQEELITYAYCHAELIERASGQRYAIAVPARPTFLSYLASHQIYLSDIWYRSPVDSGSLALPSQYTPGSCPQAESLSQVVVNLPTHREIDPTKAKYICQIVKQALSRKLS